MNRKIYILEVLLILIPTSILLIPGLLTIFLISLGDFDFVVGSSSTSYQVRFIITELFIIFSAGSLYSIWIVTVRYLGENDQTISFLKIPYLFLSIIIGCVISFAGLIEIIYPHYFEDILGIEKPPSFIGIFFYGLPICIPALHLLIISKSESFKQVKNI